MSGSCSKCNSSCVLKAPKKAEATELFGFPCDICKVILCRGCGGWSLTEIRFIEMTSRVVPYICQECVKLIRDYPLLESRVQQIQSDCGECISRTEEMPVLKIHLEQFKAELSLLKGQIQQLQSNSRDLTSSAKELQVLKVQMEKFEVKIENINESVTQTNKSYTDVLRKQKSKAEALKENLSRLEEKVDNMKLLKVPLEQFKTQLPIITSQIQQLQSDNSNLTGSVEELQVLRVRMEKIEVQIRNVDENIIQTSQSYADVLKRQNETETLKSNLSKLEVAVNNIKSQEDLPGRRANIEPTIEELKERDKRACNVLFFGVAESDMLDKNERIRCESENIKNLIASIDINVQTDQIKVLRLGRYQPEKIRPVKVIFESKETALRVLKRRTNLDRSRAVYIKSDQTPMQRKYLKDLIRELESRTEKGETDLRIKYLNSMPKIIKVKNFSVPKN